MDSQQYSQLKNHVKQLSRTVQALSAVLQDDPDPLARDAVRDLNTALHTCHKMQARALASIAIPAVSAAES